MKQTIALFFLLVITAEIRAQTEEIKTIKEHFNYVETNIEKFELATSTTFEESTDGATIKKYSDDGQLVKIRIEYLGELENYSGNSILMTSSSYSYLIKNSTTTCRTILTQKKPKRWVLMKGTTPKRPKNLNTDITSTITN